MSEMPISVTRRGLVQGFGAAAALALAPAARAALTIEIVGGSGREIPITVLPFVNQDRHADRVSEIVLADLLRSGLFREKSAGWMPRFPSEPDEVDWRNFGNRGVENMVMGHVSERADGRVTVRFRLMDAVKQTQRTGFSYTVPASQVRGTAHRIADIVYEELTGEAGVFSTRICYVVRSGDRYELNVADADGANADYIFAHREPIVSPAWSPDGSQLAYVSFERGRAAVFVHSVAEATRRVLANFDGANSSPAWAPDGERLSITLTRDGVAQIYTLRTDGSQLTRLTSSPAIDTEAHWSPDGRFLLFTSDRGGSPQIYRMSSSGGGAERVTFEGNYNVTPRWAPDGRSFCFIQRNAGRYNVAIQEVGSRNAQLLTDGRNDSSPTFSPNGRMILYASELNGRGILAAVSRDGRIKQRLSESSGSVREPAWGPLSKPR